LKKYRWATPGDLNAFFGLMLDNVLNLVVLTGILTGVFGYPAEVVYTRMIPGTAFGVLMGDLVYTWLAFRLAKRTGRDDVTAMPLGLDTPSTIGIAFAVLGPSYVASQDAILTWQVGMATLVLMGLVKVAASFVGEWIRRHVPQAGLLGSLGGVGLALLACLPLAEMFKMPVVGMVALGLVLYTLVARVRFLWGIPGAFAAVAAGAVVYYVMGLGGLLGDLFKTPELTLHLALPVPNLGFWRGITEGHALAYLPIAVPFGLLTIVGGINVTESARVAGDEYRTRDILLTEAVATLIAGFCGGVAQSTPFIGHPAYKAMGGRAAYTLATALFVGIGGCLGIIAVVVDILPPAAVMPILIFIGLEIMTQAFHVCPRRHTPAVAFAFLPCVAELVRIQLAGALAGAELTGKAAEAMEMANLLGHGFIVTAMIWGAALSLVIDRRGTAASVFMVIAAVFTLFGFIHSVDPAGGTYLPWRVDSQAPIAVAVGYLFMAVLFATIRQAAVPAEPG
jgi:AGZA family xanthine/uracil permease-like MFS transporter